ncbi:MAG: A24 family peptidase [Xanthomonadales bacterium]|nr:A24 family peptidase [Xanthomonadales bacterium]
MSELLAAAPWALPVMATVLGLLVGSFLNVVIVRLPARLEWAWRRQAREFLGQPAEEPPPPGLLFERSRCPACGAVIAWYDNVPLLSWLALRGRCRSCRAPIPLRYPLVEGLTALVTLAVVMRFGPSAEATAMLLLSWLLIAMAVIDLRTTWLPDELTLPALWLGLLSAAAGLFVGPREAILGAAVGYLSLWSVYWAFRLLTGKEGMGYGDFKLLAALGAFAGWQGILPIVLISSLLGAVVGSVYLALCRKDRATPIPFGPFLALAGWSYLMVGYRLRALWGAWLAGP